MLRSVIAAAAENDDGRLKVSNPLFAGLQGTFISTPDWQYGD